MTYGGCPYVIADPHAAVAEVRLFAAEEANRKVTAMLRSALECGCLAIDKSTGELDAATTLLGELDEARVNLPNAFVLLSDLLVDAVANHVGLNGGFVEHEEPIVNADQVQAVRHPATTRTAS